MTADRSLAARAAAPDVVPVPPPGTGLAWRPLTSGDVPAWHELVLAIEAEDEPEERYTADDLRDELVDGSWKDPSTDSLVGLDPGGTPRAFAHVDVRPGDVRSVRAFCWGGVHPSWRRRGIGTALLAWQTGRARQKLAASGKDVPWRIMAYAEESHTELGALLERAGFVPGRYYSTMRRPLAVDGAPPVPDAALPDGLRLVPFDPSLDEAVRLAHNESFAGHWGSEPRSAEDWAAWTTGHRDFRADWSHVVLDGSKVAGYTLSSAFRQEWEALGYTQGWTGLVGVRPAWRRRGVAPALLTAAMRSFAAEGIQYAGLAVDTENASGALGLYTRLGYDAVHREIAWVLEL